MVVRLALHDDLGVDLGLKGIAREGDTVEADGKIGNFEGAIRVGRDGLFQTCGQIMNLHGGVVDDSARAVGDRALNGTEGLLRLQRQGEPTKKQQAHED